MPPKKLKPVKKKYLSELKESVSAFIQLFPYILVGSALGVLVGHVISTILMYLIE